MAVFAATALVAALALTAPGGADDSMRRLRSDGSVKDLHFEFQLTHHLYEGPFGLVMGCSADPATGDLYVADAGKNAIAIFSERGSPIFSFVDAEHLREPSKAIVDRDGNILVLDQDASRIKVFSYRGEFLRHLELPGHEGKGDVTITAIAYDADWNLHVGESRSGQVQVFDAEMKLKARLGRKGLGDGQLNAIAGIAFFGDKVYVSDMDSTAVQVYAKYGRFLQGWGFHDAGLHNVSLPQGLAVDPKGRVVLIDTLRQEIKYFDAAGNMIERFGGFGTRPGEVSYPTDVAIDRSGRLCVADKGNGRAQVLSVIEAPPVPRPGDEAAVEPPSGAVPTR
jgi:DNA-binding beta-propeller fold protein YncE